MKNIAKVIFAVILIGLLYLGYSTFQDNTINIIKERHSIDSLTAEIIRLDSIHLKKDSVITVYKDSIVYVDRAIETEKTKYIYIKHKYDEIRTHVAHYTPTQLDSFFTNRYGYLKADTITCGR